MVDEVIARMESRLRDLLSADPWRMEILHLLRSLALPDSWIAAGFVRDAVWDHLHGHAPSAPAGDIDIIWFDPARTDPALDRHIEAQLALLRPDVDWSVKNQARMHLRNRDTPYADAADAMRHWPETATAIGVRLTADERLEINAPFGLDDLFGLRLVPGPAFRGARWAIFDERVRAKRWPTRYPLLQLG